MNDDRHVQGQFEQALQLHRSGKLDDAEKIYRTILNEIPTFTPALANMGVLMRTRGKPAEAINFYQRVLEQNPQDATVYSNMGHALTNLGRYADAVKACQKAIEINPQFGSAWDNLSLALKRMDRYTEAEQASERAVRIDPDNANAWNNLGSVYQAQGRIDKALAAYRKAVEIRPDFHMAHSNVLFAMLFSPAYSGEEIAREHRRWADLHVKPFVQKVWRHGPRDLEKTPLRVGFVSPDLRLHPVGTFLAPVFRARKSTEWEAYCYSDVLTPDRMTEWFRARSDGWRTISGLNNHEVARVVLEDRIDILFDLAGHTGQNRLPVFAEKPAPVQVSWMGYLDTTGLDAMDYLIADGTLVREGEESRYTETIVRMPDDFLCYDPPDFAPAVSPLPALRNGYITFGSMNQLAKVTPEVIRTWSDVLKAVPQSRLRLQGRALLDDAGVGRFALMFATHGIPESRIETVPYTNLVDYYGNYHRVDIALDPFPYVGGATTCDALWMGVPVVTLDGDRFGSRHSASHLRTAGLGEMVAENTEDYVKIAQSLAEDRDRLAIMRASLRRRMAASPLCDGERFEQNFRTALRRMWQGSR